MREFIEFYKNDMRSVFRGTQIQGYNNNKCY